MLPTLQLGPLNLQVPPLVVLLAFYLGLSLAERFAPRRGVSPDALYNLVFTALVSGILGARLGFIARNPSAFDNLWDVLSLNPGLLDPWSGFGAAFIAALIYAQRKKMPLWPTLDALTPLFGVTMLGLSVSRLASGQAFGMETDLPWGIMLWGARRHPTQIYEILAALLTLILLAPKLAPATRSGVLFARFIAVTAGWNLFLLAFRGDSTLLSFGLRAEQVTAWLILAAALALLDHLHRKPAPND